MISMLFAWALIGFFAVGVGLVVLAHQQRRERLELALEPTCLLCDSNDVALGVPPEYRCRTCGFDTRRAGGLTNELERFRALSLAADELNEAVRLLQLGVASRQESTDHPVTPIDMTTSEVTQRVMTANDYLRDVVLDTPSLLHPPATQLDDAGLMQLSNYRDELVNVRQQVRTDILGQIAADGATGAPLDFEHVVPQDYDL